MLQCDNKFLDNLYYGFMVEMVNRVNSPNSGSLPNTGFRPLYTMMGRSAAFGPIINCWAASRPLALLYNGGPLCGLFPMFSKHLEFGEFTLSIHLVKS